MENKLLEKFTILINAWVSLDERKVEELAESLVDIACKECQENEN